VAEAKHGAIVSSPDGERRRSLLSLAILIVGAAASLATSIDDPVVDAGSRADGILSRAHPVRVWRMDVTLDADAAPDDLSSFNGGEVDVTVRGQQVSEFVSGALALYVVPDPALTHEFAVVPTSPYSVGTHLHCQPGAACSRTMYLVVERREVESIQPNRSFIQVSAEGGVSSDADADSTGAVVDVTLTPVEDFSSVFEGTETTVVPPPEGQYPLPSEYTLSVTASDEASLADPNVIGYVSAWGENDSSRGSVDLFRPGVHGPGATLDVLRFDHLDLRGDGCATGSECTTDLGLTVFSDQEVSWWTESRVIFLEQKRPPADATVSVEVSES
jgi:hypothetical protein